MTERARKLLIDGGYTCVLISKEKTVTSKKRGVAPLLELIDSGNDYSGYFAADKVVGAGAAYLYVLLGVSAVWAQTVSEAARSLFGKYGIELHYENCVPHIINRSGDGICPMENSVKDASSPGDALDKIRSTLDKLNKA